MPLRLLHKTPYILGILLAANLASAAAEELIAEGRSIYRTALRTDGSAVRAIVQHDVALPAGAGACATCHRRSGIGVAEGGARSLDVTARALFRDREKPPLRPAYDDLALTRAISAGIAVDERVLDPTMPRYALTRDDARALVAYLRTLGADAPFGINETHIQLATIVADNAPAHEREAVEAVVARYVELKNAESRRESERATAASRHYYGRVRQRAHRKWNMHVWSLKGPESGWNEQLQDLYAEDQPFAIVSGTAGNGAATVQQFCERREVPCILPLSELPPGSDPGFYSLYFSEGISLQVDVTAAHIVSLDLPQDTDIRVLYVGDAAGRSAFMALRTELGRHGFNNLNGLALPPNRPPSIRQWQQILSLAPKVLVAWLPANTISALAAGTHQSANMPTQVYSMHAFSDWSDGSAIPDALRQRIWHIYPYSLPGASHTQFPREDLWLKTQGMQHLDAVSAAKVLYACRVLGAGLAEIQSNFSREYLVEAYEHSLDGTQLTSVFPRTSLGPDQRFLSRGAYVVRLTGRPESAFDGPQWIQP